MSQFNKSQLEMSGKTSGYTSGKIVELMRANSNTTIPELAEKIGLTARSIERNIQKLRETHVIRRIEGAKGGHWEVVINE